MSSILWYGNDGCAAHTTYAFLDKFVKAIYERWPRAVIQWEDYRKTWLHGTGTLSQNSFSSFNDDIQGTGAAGSSRSIVASAAARRNPCARDHSASPFLAPARVVSASLGQLRRGLMREGLDREEAPATGFAYLIRVACW